MSTGIGTHPHINFIIVVSRFEFLSFFITTSSREKFRHGFFTLVQKLLAFSVWVLDCLHCILHLLCLLLPTPFLLLVRTGLEIERRIQTFFFTVPSVKSQDQSFIMEFLIRRSSFCSSLKGQKSQSQLSQPTNNVFVCSTGVNPGIHIFIGIQFRKQWNLFFG
jgi:hypothetical protein